MTPSPFGPHLVAMVTPMRPDGAVCPDGVAALVEHLVAGGCSGIVVAGTTGEGATLSDDETPALVGQVREVVRGRASVVVGVGGTATARSVESARAARQAGADGVLAVTPPYVKPSQAGIVAHLRAVADAAGLPVMLYDVPHRTGVSLSPASLVSLADHPAVVAVKDARGDVSFAASAARSSGLAWFCGVDDLLLPYLAVGASGVVGVVSNVIPSLVSQLLAAVAAGDLGAAREVDARLAPVVGAVSAGSLGAVLAKEALVRLGVIEHATVRLPLVAAEAAERAAVAAAVESLDSQPFAASRSLVTIE